uniref:Uncharacterized protein n=1 Tax=Arundo donax TaxID=35708 RepID=A0A0A9EZK1_ARUDO
MEQADQLDGVCCSSYRRG